MSDPYSGREQTQAKHFILRKYLQELAFKVLTFQDITYVDGFSGPWESKAENFSDSSFMIAISVLLDAQKRYRDQRGINRKIRCFFSEADPAAFAQLENAVAPFHKPDEGFEIKTYCGKFEDAVSGIQLFIGTSFPLIFIDPTGWTGYPFEKIKPLFARPKCEVLINFMYAFVHRFVHSDDQETINSLDPILGGPGWRNRLDPNLDRGPAAEKLFRETLKSAGNFDFVVSTKIDKATSERPHFFITYGTKSLAGLKAFRDIEFAALREHEKNRANAMERIRQERTNTIDMFADHQAAIQEASIEELVREQMQLASADLVTSLAKSGTRPFSSVLVSLLQAYTDRAPEDYARFAQAVAERLRKRSQRHTWRVLFKLTPVAFKLDGFSGMTGSLWIWFHAFADSEHRALSSREVLITELGAALTYERHTSLLGKSEARTSGD